MIDDKTKQDIIINGSNDDLNWMKKLLLDKIALYELIQDLKKSPFPDFVL